MLRFATTAVFCLAAFSLPALAQEVTVAKPLAAASLHEGPLDMSAYYVETETGAMEVTATFAVRAVYSQPMRVVLTLADGEAATFAMPGFRGSNYSFVRAANALTVSVTPLTRTALAD